MATPPTFSSGAVLTAAQMNSVGMWKITSGTVTSGSSFDITNFSADYESYKLVLTQIRTVAGLPSIQLRLQNSGTPATTGYYYGVTQVDVAVGNSSVFRGSNAAQIDTGAVQNGGAASGALSFEIHSPFATQYTSINGQSVDTRLAGSYAGITFAGQLGDTTSYNGIRILLPSSTFTNCNYKLYGYRN